jgi:hypothetical protein
LIFALTNEAFFDMGIIDIIPSKSLQSSSMKGVMDGERPLKIHYGLSILVSK